MNPADIAQLHSQRSAAKYCRVTANTVRNWILTGRLAVQRANGRYYIHQKDLDKLLLDRSQQERGKLPVRTVVD
jgi:predicted site-specific integrase-resolvase